MQYLKRCEVIVSAVPQIEGLTADDFLQYAENKSSLLRFLPDQCDWLHVDKKWITDVLLSLDSNRVKEMIQKAKEQRRIILDSSQNSIVHMKPQFAESLKKFNHIQCKQGKVGSSIKAKFQKKVKTIRIGRIKTQLTLTIKIENDGLKQKGEGRDELYEKLN